MDAEGFCAELRRTRSITYATMDFHYEYARAAISECCARERRVTLTSLRGGRSAGFVAEWPVRSTMLTIQVIKSNSRFGREVSIQEFRAGVRTSA